MDKTLLRPLFKKRYLELNPPRGFKAGAAIDFQQVAMGNQSKQNDKGIMELDVINNPVSGIDEDVNKETAVEVLDPTVKTETVEAIQKGREKAKQDSLFTDSERLGIFAALLSQGIGRPGPITENIGPALSGAALGLADLRATEAELSPKLEFKDSEQVFDKLTGSTAFATEQQKQTEFLEDGSPRYVPVGEKGKEKLITVYDTVEKRPRTIFESEVLSLLDKNPNQERFISGLNSPIDVELLEDVPGLGSKGDETSVTQAEILTNPSAYKKQKNQFLDSMTKYVKKPEIEAQRKRYDAAFTKLQQGAHLDDIIQLIESDVKERGAVSGGIGKVSQAIASGKAYAAFLGLKIERDKAIINPKSNRSVYAENYNDLELAMRNPDAYLNKYNIDKNSRQGRSLRTLAGSFKSEFAQADAALDSSLINLAYAVAKAREEGGRFSVSDIELALRSIGGSSNTNILLTKLARTGFTILSPAVKDFEDSIMMMDEELDPKGKFERYRNNKRLFKLRDRVEEYKYYGRQEQKARDQKKKEIEQGGGQTDDLTPVPDPYQGID
jgi:hypothetical protein